MHLGAVHVFILIFPCFPFYSVLNLYLFHGSFSTRHCDISFTGKILNDILQTTNLLSYEFCLEIPTVLCVQW